MSHTPTPYRVKMRSKNATSSIGKTHIMHDSPEYPGGCYGVAHVFGDDYEHEKANAEFIVRACNSHTELLEALKALVPLSQFMADSHENTPGRAKKAALFDKAIKKAQAIIAKAEGN